VIERVDLGLCSAYDYGGDGPTAVVLPGAMLGGMPAVWFAFEPLLAAGWRVVLAWWEVTPEDREADRWDWTAARAASAVAYAGGADLLIGKSLGVYGIARDELPAVALTPNLTDPELVEALRTRGGPLLLVGGTDDPMWDGEVARALSPDVLELPGADHGLAHTADGPRVGEAVERFSVRSLGSGA
jgi:pimeloyl-ACP methyl ester carboxylesterase